MHERGAQVAKPYREADRYKLDVEGMPEEPAEGTEGAAGEECAAKADGVAEEEAPSKSEKEAASKEQKEEGLTKERAGAKAKAVRLFRALAIPRAT